LTSRNDLSVNTASLLSTSHRNQFARSYNIVTMQMIRTRTLGSRRHSPPSPPPASPPRSDNNRSRLNSTDTQNSNASGVAPLIRPPARQNRPRINSHPSDIPRTYSGLYGTGGSSGDLLPFELTRNRNTDWIDTATPILLLTYLLVIFAFEAAILSLVSWERSWTVSNVTHGFITMMYLHWIKGSPNYYEQGEMNGMTTWEQIISDPHAPRRNQKTALFVVPTLLCYAACQFCDYDKVLCGINVVVWAICVVAKLERMNGVRIFGINKTVGVDDDDGEDDVVSGGRALKMD